MARNLIKRELSDVLSMLRSFDEERPELVESWKELIRQIPYLDSPEGMTETDFRQSFTQIHNGLYEYLLSTGIAPNILQAHADRNSIHSVPEVEVLGKIQGI